MGWSGGYYSGTTKERMTKHLADEGSNPDALLALSVKGNTGYGAYRSKDGSVFGFVILAERHRDGVTMFKTIDETMGPYFWQCPQKILNLLTPTENENALKWRKACQENIDRRKTFPKLVAGMKVKLPYKLSFGGMEEDTFTVVQRGAKGFLFQPESAGGYYHLCRITNWRNRPFEVIG